VPESGFGAAPPSAKSLFDKDKETQVSSKQSRKQRRPAGRGGVCGGDYSAPRPSFRQRLHAWMTDAWHHMRARGLDDDPPVDALGGIPAPYSPTRSPSKVAPKPPQNPNLPLYMQVLNDRKVGYEVPYFMRADQGADIEYVPPPPASAHRFGHRYYIQFLDDVYHHQPRKVTFLHLFHTHAAAKLELQFHRYEHMFEPLLQTTVVVALPVLLTHFLPGAVMYAWVVALWVFIGTCIGIAIQLIWFALGPGLSFECTDTFKRTLVEQFMSRLLLRVVVVLVFQTVVNYMALYYFHVDALAESASIGANATSVSGGYVENLLVEFNLRTQSLYPCYLGAVLDGYNSTDPEASSLVHTFNVLVTLDWL
jgi:hypothetical protein